MKFKSIQIILASVAFSKTILSSPISNSIENKDALKKSNYSNEESDNEFKDLSANNISGKIVKESDNNVCSTSECAKVSSIILEKLDPKVDPCEDFYQFTCGKFLEETTIQDDEDRVMPLTDLQKENIDILRSIIENDYKEDKNLTKEQQALDGKMFEKLKNMYNSCMDVNTINAKGSQPLNRLLDQLDIQKYKTTYKTADGLTDIVAKLFRYHIPIFIKLEVYKKYRDSDQNIIYISQGDLALKNKQYYENDTMTSKYQENIKTMFTNIYGKKSKRDFDQLSKSIVELEKKLANILNSPESVYDYSFHVDMDIKSLNKKYSYINWSSLFEKIPSSITIKDDFPVTIKGTSYFDHLEDILKETEADTIAAYAEWSIIKEYGKYISEDIKQPLNHINGIIKGVTKEKERSTYCISLMNPIERETFEGIFGLSLSIPFSKYFVAEVFGPESKRSVEEIIKNLKEAMKKRIPQMSWIDKQTGENAIEKIDAIVDKIGYPEDITSPEKLTEAYKDLEIVKDDFFTNVLHIAKFQIESTFAEVYKPKDKTKFEIPPALVNAAYEPTTNDITFPVGILRPPLFNRSFPDFFNYGAIGSALGHELTHAFDSTGKDFDINGNIKNWWTNSTAEEFDKLTQCFIDQYNEYTVEGIDGNPMKVNGIFSLGENLADSGGLARSYEAYKKKGKKNHQGLPGLTQYTNDQLFYISYGQLWCSKERPEFTSMLILMDPHAPSRYRANGVLSNSEHFAETFKCKKGSPMNPEKKCKIW